MKTFVAVVLVALLGSAMAQPGFDPSQLSAAISSWSGGNFNGNFGGSSPSPTSSSSSSSSSDGNSWAQFGQQMAALGAMAPSIFKNGQGLPPSAYIPAEVLAGLQKAGINVDAKAPSADLSKLAALAPAVDSYLKSMGTDLNSQLAALAPSINAYIKSNGIDNVNKQLAALGPSINQLLAGLPTSTPSTGRKMLAGGQ